MWLNQRLKNKSNIDWLHLHNTIQELKPIPHHIGLNSIFFPRLAHILTCRVSLTRFQPLKIQDTDIL